MSPLYVKTLFAFATASLLVAAPQMALAKDSQPLVIKPSSPWNVDYGKETCRLVRTFGEGENRHAIFFEQWGPDAGFAFTAGGAGFKRFKGGRKTWFHTSEGHEPTVTEPFKGKLNTIGPALIYTRLHLENGQQNLTDPDLENASADELASIAKALMSFPQLDTGFAKTAQYISLKQGSREVILKTGPLEEPFKVLNDCASSLITEWGLDLEQHKTRTRPPLWSNRNAIVRRIVASYPKAALNKGEQGIIQMRVNIDEGGAVTHCTIGKATDTRYLDSPACGPMKMAKFLPGLDKDGKPMASYYRTNIIYQIGR